MNRNLIIMAGDISARFGEDAIFEIIQNGQTTALVLISERRARVERDGMVLPIIVPGDKVDEREVRGVTIELGEETGNDAVQHNLERGSVDDPIIID